MSFSLIASAQNTGGNHTTGAIDSTGANLIVLAISGSDDPNNATGGITDSKGNTYTAMNLVGATQPYLRVYYVFNPTVGSSHTVTLGTGSFFPGICFAAFSGADTAPLEEQQSGTGTGSSGAASASVTPNEDNELVIGACCSGINLEDATPNGGFSVAQQHQGQSGVGWACALGYLIQTTAAAANPTWSWTTSGSYRIHLAAFQAAAGGASAEGGGMLLGSRRNRLTIP